MTVQTTSNLSNSVRTQYVSAYNLYAWRSRLYDQFASPNFLRGLSLEEAMKGSTIQIPFISHLSAVQSALSQVADITPVVLTDTYATVTPTSRGNAIQWSQQLDIQAYTDYADQRLKIIGENAAESIDYVAMEAMLQGSLVKRGAARASLDAGTSGHRLSDSVMAEIETWMQTLACPAFLGENTQSWAALMHPAVFYDLRESGNVDSVGLYQNQGISLNWELGKLGPFRLIVNANAKVFGGAGTDNAGNMNELITTAMSPGDKTFTCAAGTHADDGDWITLGTEEIGNTFYPTNEMVKYVSGTTTVTFVGSGENGGCRYAHPTTDYASNNDSVYPVAFGGPESLAKTFVPEVGEFGEVVGPEEGGLLHQFRHVGWKWWGAYSRVSENRLIRGEFSTSLEA